MIGAIGAFSLVAETVLIYLFQARHGLLFSLVGVLLAAFMVGLASGAAAGLHAPPRWRLAPAISPLALVGAGALILWLAPRGFGASLPATTLLIFAIGFFDGLAYPLCIRLAGEGSSLRLYASELSGAAVGNLAVAALVLPLAGPSAAIAVSAAFLAVVSLPLAFGRPPRR
jgi:spermidine synthase